MKFSGKMCFEIILKVTKNEGFTLSLEDTFFRKPHGGRVNLTPPGILGLTGDRLQLYSDSSTVFSCEFCGIFKNTFFTEQLWTTGSENIYMTTFEKNMVLIKLIYREKMERGCRLFGYHDPK